MKKVFIYSIACLAFLIILPGTSSAAGMQNQLDNIFLEMENYTAPGSYETQRRSAYFGGRYTYKTAIFDENLISMQLPSARGGCGGIDVFGGSFSFVNSDQIVALLRQVASNAKGYAFQLAMDNMCPDCMKWMNELQAKMQALSSALSNSCQLAQGIINDVSETVFKKKEEENLSIMATLQGVGEDFADVSKHVGSALTSAQRMFDADPAAFNDTTGSVVYKALKQHSAENWFSGGDEELLETIMSMTGSVVVGGLVTGEEGDGQTTEIWVLPGNKLTILDLIEGAQNKEIYDCSLDVETNHCRINPDQTQTINIDGLKDKILNAFTGPNGLITWVRTRNINGAMTTEQINILAAMPHAIGSKIFQLAPLSPEAATQLVNDSIDAITLEYINRLVNSSYDAVLISLANHKNDYKPKALEQLAETRKVLNMEFKSLADNYGSIRDIEGYYSEIIKNVQKPKYLSADAQNSNKPE